MGKMRCRMEEELRLRGYAERTVETYLAQVARFVRHHQRPPEEMGAAEVRAYLVHLTKERRLTWSTVNQAVCALRFFYLDVLGRAEVVERVRYQKRRKSLPVVLSEAWQPVVQVDPRRERVFSASSALPDRRNSPTIPPPGAWI